MTAQLYVIAGTVPKALHSISLPKYDDIRNALYLPAALRVAEALWMVDSAALQGFLSASNSAARALRAQAPGALERAIDLVNNKFDGLAEFVRQAAHKAAAPIVDFVKEHPSKLKEQCVLLLAAAFDVHDYTRSVAESMKDLKLFDEKFVRQRILEIRSSIFSGIAQIMVGAHPDQDAILQRVIDILATNVKPDSFCTVTNRSDAAILESTVCVIHKEIVYAIVTFFRKRAELDRATSKLTVPDDHRARKYSMPAFIYVIQGVLRDGKSLVVGPQSPYEINKVAVHPGLEEEKFTVHQKGPMKGCSMEKTSCSYVTNDGKLIGTPEGPAWFDKRTPRDWFQESQRIILETLAFAPGLFFSGKLTPQALVVVEPRRILIGLPESVVCPTNLGISLFPRTADENAKLAQAISLHPAEKFRFYLVQRLDGQVFLNAERLCPEKVLAHALLTRTWDGSFQSFGEMMRDFGCSFESGDSPHQVVTHKTHGRAVKVYPSELVGVSLGGKEKEKAFRASKFIEAMVKLGLPISLLTQRLLYKDSIAKVSNQEVLESW